ncbi:MAG TPA: DUF1236 domain-containing protein [Rhizobiaceae bacterium]|nr:DUF1236 domain-containing protein [Rhizobiaceae bacterium]
MRNYFKAAGFGLGAALLLSSTAQAQTTVQATADLNVRSGPGPQYEVVGVIPQGGDASVMGCNSTGKWCSVSVGSVDGWAYSDYLTASVEGQPMVVTKLPQSQAVPVVEYDGSANTATGAVGGAVVGALIGGPIGAAIGGAAGAAIGANTPPPDNVRNYVIENRPEPVYLDGEVVVGAGLPETVELRTIPDYQYRYVYVNGVPALVDPGTRRIVYVYR